METAPRVEALIASVMARFPGKSDSASGRYFEAVHQELAPLARELEASNRTLQAENEALRTRANETDKWKGLALAKGGDGRTVQEIERPLQERIQALETWQRTICELLAPEGDEVRPEDAHDVVSCLRETLAITELALENSGNRHEYTAPPGMVFMPEDTQLRLDDLERKNTTLQASLYNARTETIEEVAAWYATTGWIMDEDDVAEAIRKLKETPSAPPAPATAQNGPVRDPLGWIGVNEQLPAIDVPVWLYEEGRGIWIGGRGDAGDEWLWGNCYGSWFYDHNKGCWGCRDLEIDDNYAPTLWMQLPAIHAQSSVMAADQEGA